ncbi:metallophosphoesterase family protein [Desulforhopalus singaporensis]|uniref:DNA repair exonuclease SbcCD nuclease subunit n=1 Tax=Desulforhopalus singaporensis TaxID=91360 RepID=A0A1H0KNZ9_9BACT|nr:DNA repair exonuclease [Desulforhopalus singaporensis]SDO57668.1 DNA repair exonuclease SbcCD nuclease subunit [Desulforhopalus singaporensis]
MFRFLHTADIHLDSPLKGLEAHEDAPADEIRGATRRAFDNLIDLAIDEEVAFVLIAGDLYDGDWKDYNTGLYFAGRMGRLDKAGIQVFIVSGNHDAASNTTKALPLPDNVFIFSHSRPESKKIDDLGVIIHGQGYAFKAVTDNLGAEYPVSESGYFNIGLLHTSLTGRENHASYAPCSLDDLQSKGYDYWALGHVHKREIVSENPTVVFPGNIQGRHIKETGAKGATLVTVEDGTITGVETRDLDVLRWAVCDVDLSTCTTAESVYEAVRAAFEHERDEACGRTVALRLVLTGRCPVHAQLLDRTFVWTEKFRAIAESIGGVWLETVKFKTTRQANLDELVGEDTPIAGLIASIWNLELGNEDPILSIPDLAALQSRLPAEIQTDDDPLWDTSPGKMAELCAEIQEMLISMLLQHGEKK